jgi:hypothetical protein
MRQCTTVNYDVTLINWTDFYESMMEPQKRMDLWRQYKTCDLIMAGIDFTIEFVYPKLFPPIDRASGSFSFHCSNHHYGLSLDNYDTYIRSEARLRSLTIMWPNPVELRLYGDKLSLIANLNDVAHNVTRTVRPKNIVMKPGCEIPPDVVIKRGYSEVGSHVLLPGDARRAWSYLERQQNIPRASWFYQPFVEHLLHMGEWRIFMVDCKPVYTMWTRKNRGSKDLRDQWSFILVEDFYPLDIFRLVLWPQRSSQILTSIRSAMSKAGEFKFPFQPINPTTLSQQDVERGRTEFLNFAQSTYMGLIASEERELRCKSGLRLFGRLDIGVIEYALHEFHYWVNELDRTQNATLWACAATNKACVLAATIAAALPSFISL